MNELHDYPPDWDEQDIADSPEFEGLLTKNVEALFTSKGVNDDFLVLLSEKQLSCIGTDLITALVLFLKESRPERIAKDPHYALLLSEKLEELREALQYVAEKHVTEEAKQELAENLRDGMFEQKLRVAGF